jgi:crooked neck
LEIEEEEWERSRDLYERLLQRTAHVKVWVSYAKFEVQAEHADINQKLQIIREIFQRGYKKIKELGLNEEVRFVG